MNLKTLGVVLILAGAGALLLGNLSYTEMKPVMDVGPVHVKAEEEHRLLNIPTIAGVVVLVSGLALIFLNRRA